MPKRYRMAHFDEIAPTRCRCGTVRRAFADEPGGAASFHVVHIEADSAPHYHKKLTEIYYVLEGEGHVELDGERVAVRPGHVVRIDPFCRHRAVGKLTLINVPVPAFDPEDEWTD
jgi:mannose-6-phosphate isomerase-like protein (cupin superfamily)